MKEELLKKVSVSNASWKIENSFLNEIDSRRVSEKLTQDFQIPKSLSKHLARIGINSENFEDYINPLIKNTLPDPLIMKDAGKAISLICDAIKEKKKIGIFGDYDVDGACSVALFKIFLTKFGSSLFTYIPDRFKEGYGPNKQALNKFKEKKVDLIITVDCGISSHDVFREFKNTDVKIIIIDHHKASPNLPKADAIVNPNRLDDNSNLGYLCAAGLTFIILAGILREIKSQKIFFDQESKINLMHMLDLVSLATVCDIVPLYGVNRAFVKQGLKILAKRNNLGLKALCDVSKLNKYPDTHTLGYILGPRINAGGRLSDSNLGLNLLSGNNEENVFKVAQTLDDLNNKRKDIERDVLIEAETIAEKKLNKNPNLPLIIVAGDGWHEGVIGIVAGRIKDKYNKPSIVISFDQKSIGKGSGRGVSNFSLSENIILAKQMGFLIEGGGHDMAVGLKIQKKNLNEFEEFILKKAEKLNNFSSKVLYFTDFIPLSRCNFEFIDYLDKIGPFGAGHSEPRFIINNCKIKNHKWIGKEQQHFSATIDDGSGTKIKAIAFSSRGTKLGDFFLADDFSYNLSMLVRIHKNNFGGFNSIQLLIDDITY